MLTTGTGPRPAVVTLFMTALGGESRFWGRIMAMTLMIGTPPVVFYVVARRYLAQSFELG
jgi:ABC-type glycerol-3-phosphate transport system permease component